MIALTGVSLMLLGSVQAAPLLETRQGLSIRDDAFTTTVGVPATNRTIFAMISLICVGLLSFLLGSRFGRLKQSILIKRNFISILVLLIYTLVLVFIIATTVLVAAQGLKTYRLCLAGTWVCLILYTFTKGAIFLFLVERIHVVRAPFVQRKNDKIYLGCLAIVLLTFGPVVVNCYIQPVTYMATSNGRCYFGIRGSASIPILAVNLFVDLVLTGVFFYLLRPAVRVPDLPTVSKLLKSWSNKDLVRTQDNLNETAAQRTIRTLLWKSIIGSLLIEIPMMANMIQFVITRGHEFGTICAAVCVVEVVFDVLVIHWLAFGTSAQAERDLERSFATSSQSPLTRPPSSNLCKQVTDDGAEKTHAGFWITQPEVARLKPQEFMHSESTSVGMVLHVSTSP